MLYNPSGKPVEAVEVWSNVTEHKRVEEALKLSQEYARNIINSSLDMVIAVDNDRKIVEFNRAAQETFGYTFEEVLGRHVNILYAHPDEGHTIHATTMMHGRCVQEVFNRRKNGEVFPSFLSASVMKNKRGEAVGVMGISRDITEYRQAQERESALVKQLFQAQKMEAIGALAGGIAHDFNNLLTIIIGFAQLILQEKDLNAQAREYAARIPELGKQAAHQIAQLLTFSRQAPMEQMPIPLLSLIKETIKMLGRTMPENIVIRQIAPEKLSWVNADPTQLQQMLMNLCINASQAMPDGGTMTIGLENIVLDEGYCRQYPDARPGQHIFLSVKDTGVGMPPAVQEHIFEPFFTTQKSGEGTGLGLATVYGIVKAHQGHITVHSQVGKGSEFKVYLPAMEGKRTVANDAVQENPAGGTETILLVEDSAWLLTVGRKMLEELGYTVRSASNGEEALQIYRAHQDEVALVLTDLVMPKIGGQELYEMLRQINPTVRALLMSGYGLEETVADLRAKGAKGFVQKPFDLNDLSDAVRQALDR